MNLIKHVAIIMDGNGRWGIKKKNSRKYGHTNGIKAVEKILKSTISLKIPYLTLYTFSTENWQRPNLEISFLFELMRKYFKKNLRQIIKKKIRIKIIGKKNGLPKDILQIINDVEKKTKKNTGINLILALNYGSKEEIVNACKRIIKKNKPINIESFKTELYTSDIPDPEILIRTGGKKRLSNFLLWQAAYSELFFVNKLWPDFNESDYESIIKKFKRIKRSFGNILWSLQSLKKEYSLQYLFYL